MNYISKDREINRNAMLLITRQLCSNVTTDLIGGIKINILLHTPNILTKQPVTMAVDIV